MDRVEITVTATHTAALTAQGTYFAGVIFSVSESTAHANGEEGVAFTGRYWGQYIQVQVHRVEIENGNTAILKTEDGWKSGISTFNVAGNVATWVLRTEKGKEKKSGFARREDDKWKLYMNTVNTAALIDFEAGVDFSAWQTATALNIDSRALSWTPPSWSTAALGLATCASLF